MSLLGVSIVSKSIKYLTPSRWHFNTCCIVAKKICVTFEDTLKYTGEKGVHTGTPIRPELYDGEAKRGLEFTGFSGENLYRDMAAGGYDNIANTLQTVKHTVRMFEILSSKPSDSEPSAGVGPLWMTISGVWARI